MSQSYNSNRIPNTQSNESTSSSILSVSIPGEVGRTRDDEREKTNSDTFIGKERLLELFHRQLKHFEEWYEQRDWLAFHHHHYDWWMFPIDEISSHNSTYKLPHDVLINLKSDEKFITELRKGVRLMVTSWGWDIENRKLFVNLDGNQKWSYWPVRLYKAGKCMWLFGQNDYYESLKQLAHYIKDEKGEKLDYFSHTKQGKANVLEQWNLMEQKK